MNGRHQSLILEQHIVKVRIQKPVISPVETLTNIDFLLIVLLFVCLLYVWLCIP